jgi:hypothetical protein
MTEPDSAAAANAEARHGFGAVRHVAWRAITVQIMALAVALVLARLVLGPGPFSLLAGVILYLLHARVVRALLLRHHASGMAALRARDFAAAVREFEASHAFLTRHAWIDHHRTVVLLSPSPQSFREMALLNAAFAELQRGRAAAARALYRRVLDEWPASTTAAAALRWLDAVDRGA